MPAHIAVRDDQYMPGTFALSPVPQDNFGALTFVHGEVVSYQLPVTGPYTGPLSWSVTSGSLPPGLSLSAAGVVSGTPTAVGTAEPVTVQAVDSGTPPKFATAALTVTIS